MAKRMLADVIWQAANTNLSVRAALWADMDAGLFNYSCCAVLEALRPGWYAHQEEFDDLARRLKGMRFLKSLGCDPQTDFFGAEYNNHERRQGARYMWLLMAMHVAEDEGIEV